MNTVDKLKTVETLAQAVRKMKKVFHSLDNADEYIAQQLDALDAVSEAGDNFSRLVDEARQTRHWMNQVYCNMITASNHLGLLEEMIRGVDKKTPR